MDFDRSQWFDRIKDSLRELAQRTGETLNRWGATTVWGGLMASVVLPVLEAVSRQPDQVQNILTTTLAAVGGNLLANRVERWKESTTPADQAVRELEEAVLAEPALAKEAEQVLQNLVRDGMPVLSSLTEAAAETGSVVVDRLANELAILHRAGRFQSLRIATGDVATGKARIVKVEKSPGAIVANRVTIVRSSGKRADLAALQQKFTRFLVDTYKDVDLHGGIPQMLTFKRIPLTSIFVVPRAAREVPSIEALPRPGRGKHGPDLRREASDHSILLTKAVDAKWLMILGEPGSGKSSFIKYATLALAGYSKAREISLKGDWLPIPLSVSSYAEALRKDPDLPLSGYLPRYFKGKELPDLTPLFRQALASGRSVLLLDGLDEVLSRSERLQVAAQIQALVREHRKNRFVVTSRIAGYRDAPLPDFTHVTIQPFKEAEIRQFALRWCRAYESGDRPSRARTLRAREVSERLLDAILPNEAILQLATNPLLLTILALVFYSNEKLPNRRVKLYRFCVEALAETWNRKRPISAKPLDLYFGERPITAEMVVNLLGPVALWLQEHSPEGLIADEELKRIIADRLAAQEQLVRGKALALSGEFVELMRAGTGLLQARGMNQYGFLHLQFQEYLAARAIEHLDLGFDPAAFLLEHLGEPRWREVTRLAVASASQQVAGKLVRGFLASEKPDPWSGPVMAGLCLTDAGKEGVAGEVWAQTVKSLLELISRPGAPLERRVEAGNVLGDLGDPRIKDLPTPEDMAEIPAGEFLMGTSREQVEALAAGYEWAKEWKAKGWFDDELTGEPVFVDTFCIDRYPVTNLQFARFAAETGYRTTAEKHKGAETWRTFARPGRQNHPVVNVSWHDAVAYCRWRREKTGLAVSLPSEAQWEKAARGRDRRVWPWGNDWDASRANTWEGKVGETTAVGIYPTEGGPIKCYDMAGNVWEWTSSLYKPYPYKADDGREELNAEGPRVLRGGSWNGTAGYARSACRPASTPPPAGAATSGSGVWWRRPALPQSSCVLSSVC